MKPFLGDGGLGDYLTVGEQYGIARVPHGLDLQAAGALGLAGTAALNAIDDIAPTTGEHVLISGATGGVGAIALQYAAAAGAEVIATSRPGAEADFVHGLGAAHVVDYAGDLAAQVRAIAPDGVPAVLHMAGDAEQLTGLLAAGGRIASTMGFGPDQHPAAAAVMANPDPATLDRLSADAASGVMRVPITRTYPLDRAPQALADFAAGSLGKLAITLQGGRLSHAHRRLRSHGKDRPAGHRAAPGCRPRGSISRDCASAVVTLRACWHSLARARGKPSTSALPQVRRVAGRGAAQIVPPRLSAGASSAEEFGRWWPLATPPPASRWAYSDETPPTSPKGVIMNSRIVLVAAAVLTLAAAALLAAGCGSSAGTSGAAPTASVTPAATAASQPAKSAAPKTATSKPAKSAAPKTATSKPAKSAAPKTATSKPAKSAAPTTAATPSGASGGVLKGVPAPSGWSGMTRNGIHDGGAHLHFTSDLSVLAALTGYKSLLTAAGWTIAGGGGSKSNAGGLAATGPNGRFLTLKLSGGGGHTNIDLAVWPRKPSNTNY